MFNVNEFMADQDLQPYPFTDKNGEVWQLPNIGVMTATDGARLLSGELEAVLNEYVPGLGDAYAATPSAALKALTREWFEHCEIEIDEQGNLRPGKSSASSPSSRPTARPSKPTSRSGGSKTRKR